MTPPVRLSGVEAKAVRLVANDHVHALPAARAFTVISDKRTAVFLVVLSPKADACSCPAGRNDLRCSHILACTLIVEREAQAAGVAA